MIADTTFASDYLHEQRRGVIGPAGRFFARHRARNIRLTVITAGEISVAFASTAAARQWLERWQVLLLHTGIMDAAAEIDREQISHGRRLGENDNWIAGFARYYREPLISRDGAFDAVPGLRRVAYP